MAVIETGGRPVVGIGDVGLWFGELDEPHTEGQLRVCALDPELVWLAQEHEPRRPRHEAEFLVWPGQGWHRGAEEGKLPEEK
jgi:hypothetical protein